MVSVLFCCTETTETIILKHRFYLTLQKHGNYHGFPVRFSSGSITPNYNIGFRRNNNYLCGGEISTKKIVVCPNCLKFGKNSGKIV